ncbi:MAG: hypothetical protein IIB32_12275 [Chloroflexi bacterium]|nr:hypothetical protein [Chloroflexota bacterium]
MPGSDQFTIPTDAAANAVIKLTVTIVGTDGVDSTGTANFTVTSRVLVVVPTSGPRGTKILITGTKFGGSKQVASNSIKVDTKDTVHAEANLTSSGDVPGISLAIPKDAGIGSVTIELLDSSTPQLKGTVKFTVTEPTIALGSNSATMGERVGITGAGWVPLGSVTITVANAAGTLVLTQVATADGAGNLDTSLVLPSTVGVGSQIVTFTAKDSTFDNTATAQTLKIPKPSITLSVAEAVVGEVVTVEAAGFPPSSGLSKLEIGLADVRTGVKTSNTQGALTTSFIVPGLTGSQIVTVKIGAETVSTSLTVLKTAGTAAAATTAPAEIFADLIANDDNLVRVWRFSNATQTWEFYDPRPAFEQANTLEKSGAGDIVWVNVTSEQAFQSTTLFPGWNLISLD